MATSPAIGVNDVADLALSVAAAADLELTRGDHSLDGRASRASTATRPSRWAPTHEDGGVLGMPRVGERLEQVLVAADAAVAHEGDVALQALAESARIDQQIGRKAGRSYSLAVAAAVHLARDQAALSISALGAHDAHPITGTTRP